MLTTEEYKLFIQVAQGEDEIASQFAVTDILFDIIENHMNKHLYKYYGKATTGGMDDDDIRQIFLIAVGEAINTARTDIGSPLLYLIQKGKWAVTDELRKGYRRAIRQYCHKCNKESRIFEKGGTALCPTCHSDEHIERMMVDILDDNTHTVNVEATELTIEEVIVSEQVISEFKATLSGRTLEVYEMIMEKGYDRSACNNYIKEIASEMNVTPTNINLRLRKIKEAWSQFTQAMEELGY